MHNPCSSSHILQDIRKGDVALFVCFLILAAGIAFFPLLGGASARGSDVVQADVTIRVAGDLYGKYSLSRDQELAIQTSYGSNTVVIKDGAVSVTRSDCNNQICVQHRPISETGEMIVCLPHRLSVEITSKAETDAPAYDAIAR